MQKITCCLLLLGACAFNANVLYAQEGWCCTDDRRDSELQSIPDGENIQREFEMFLRQKQQWLKEDRAQRAGINPILNLDYFIIPVVFHVVYDPVVPESNIPFERIESQMNVLNAYMNGGLSNQEDARIQFCLAQNTGSSQVQWTDANERGVRRYNNAALSDHMSTIERENALMAETNTPDVFPFERYLNIWIVSEINNSSGILGYSPQPLEGNSSSASSLDGIVIRYDAVGSVDDDFESEWPFFPGYNKGKTIVHELGHYFNLYHIFHSGCLVAGQEIAGDPVNGCDLWGDFVCDTPTQGSFNYNFNCDSTDPLPNTCSENYEWADLIANQSHNYLQAYNTMDAYDFVACHMGYSPEACRKTFSFEQVIRMHASILTMRSILSSSQNLIFTGVVGPAGCLQELLTADIIVDDGEVINHCIGDVVNFETPSGEGYSAVEWIWDFGDGSTVQGNSPSYSFDSPGSNIVTLTAIDSEGNQTINTIFVYISNCALENLGQAQWVFGQYVSLDFTSGIPVPSDVAYNPPNGLESTMLTCEGAITENDPQTGEILFYSSGHHVWDGQGNNLNGNVSLLYYNNPILLEGCNNVDQNLVYRLANSSARMACVPWPNNPGHWFILATTENEVSNEYWPDPPVLPLNVIHVDLTVEGGHAELWGRTTSEDLLPSGLPNHMKTLLTSISLVENFVVIPHCNGTDYWFLGCTPGSLNPNRHIVSFLISEGGFSDYSMDFSSWDGNLKETDQFVYSNSWPFPELPYHFVPHAVSKNNDMVVSENRVAGFNTLNGLIDFVDENSGAFTNPVFSPSGNYIYAGTSAPRRINISTGPPYTVEFLDSEIFGYGHFILGPEDEGLERIYAFDNYDNLVYAVSNIESADINNVLVDPILDLSTIGNCALFTRDILFFRNEIPEVVFGIIGNQISCFEYEFSIPSCFQNYEIAWDLGDGTTTENVTSITHSYVQQGDYEVTVIISRSGGLFPHTAVLNVSLDFDGFAQFVTPNPICLGQEQELSIVPSDIFQQYTWTTNGGGLFGNGTITTTGTYNTISWDESGTWQLTVTAQPAFEGCPVGTRTVEVLVLELPEVFLQIECLKIIAYPLEGTVPYEVEWFDEQGNSLEEGFVVTVDGPGTYTVTVTDANGCSIVQEFTVGISPDCCIEDTNPPPAYIIPAYTDVYWDTEGEDYILLSDLIIQEGANLYITDREIQLGEGVKIVVYPNATLFLTNSTLTHRPGCGMWKGVECMARQKIQPPFTSYRGTLRAYSSYIEYAENAFSNYITGANGEALVAYTNEQGTPVPLAQSYLHCKQGAGGIMYALNSTFRNNVCDARFNKYYRRATLPPHHFIQDGSSFGNCNFLIDEDFDINHTPADRVYLRNVISIPFTNCRFENEVEAYCQMENDPLVALNVREASYEVTGSTTAGNLSTSATKFSGFAYGIYQISGRNGFTCKVDKMKFNCYRGIYSSNPYSLKVYRSWFEDYAFAQAPMHFTQTYAQHAFGLYAQKAFTSARYDVRENHFNLDNFESVGCIMNDVGKMNSTVYGNFFNHQVPLALGLYNRNRNANGSTGLLFQCNQFDAACQHDVFSFATDDTNPHAGINMTQAYEVDLGGQVSAGNQFFNTGADPLAFEHADNTTNTFNYYVSNQDSFDPAEFGGVNLILNQLFNQCDELLIASPNWDVRIADLDMEIAVQTAIRQLIVDGGDTEGLTQEVLYAGYSEALQLYYTLLQQSPSLSEEVMIATIEREFPLPSVLLTQLLSANPTAAKSALIRKALDAKTEPLSELQMQAIDQGLNLLSPKEVHEARISALNAQRDHALQRKMEAIDADWEHPDPLSAKLALYANPKCMADVYTKAGLLMAVEDYAAAKLLLQNAPTTFALTQPEQDELADLVYLIDLTALQPETLSPAQQADLQTMAANSCPAAGAWADALLAEHGLSEIYSPIYLPDEVPPGLRSGRLSSSSAQLSEVVCYPNPATLFIVVNSQVDEITGIKVTDAVGKMLSIVQYSANSLQQVVDTSGYAAGIYHFEVTLSNGIKSILQIAVEK